jgi:hypothetical protein
MINTSFSVVEEQKTNLMSLAILFHFLCTQHVLDINTSNIRSLRLCCWITTSVVLFCKDEGFCVSVNLWCLVVCVSLDVLCRFVVVGRCIYFIDIDRRKLLMMDILISETYWVHKKWNKIASDIKLVSYSSTITMMQVQ